MKHLVLLGAGHAHIHMLSTLVGQPLAGVRVTLVAPYPRQLYSGMIPGFVAGYYALEDCVIALEPLLAGSGVTWLRQCVVGLDANTRTITLNDASRLTYDLVSINTGPVQDRQKLEQSIPGAQQHALFIRPIESFGVLWPRVVELAQSRALRVTVIGGGAAGVELACAVAHRLSNARVTLISGAASVGANYSQAVQARIQRALARRQITVLQDRATGLTADAVLLANGAQLACDVPILATGAQAPTWLQASGLALDASGFISVDASLRSTSHPQVFAAGDVCSRVDRAIARSGVYAVRAGVPLANNLRAVLAGAAPVAHQPPKQTLNLLSCGKRYAIGIWGCLSFEGQWVWWLKDRIDRGFIRRYAGQRSGVRPTA
ncbi:MAG: FAD-dependent oxidoreductase [Rhodoferax sp.]|nr:FAD-dependent oxidoreductase [Rhodoferax sp.]